MNHMSDPKLSYDEQARIFHRPGTLDHTIFEQIHRHDEYRLRKEQFGPEDIVLDIGGHAGYFALAALQRGAGHVHVFEISEENLELCRRNLALFEGRVTLHRRAVWNETGRTVSFGGFPDWEGEVNTGGISPYGQGPRTVETIAFDEVVRDIADGLRKRIRLVKLDAEGSEWPILLTSRTLASIDQIVGEYHEIGGDFDQFDPAVVGLPGFTRYTRDELTSCLKQAGFRVRIVGCKSRLGQFFARRPRWRFWR